MTGYRVAGEEPADPLAIDPARCRQQSFRHQLLVQVVAVLLTAGLWLPGLLVWLFLASRRVTRVTEGYRARIGAGRLEIGNAVSMQSIPLDTITGVRVHDGYVTVTVRVGQPAQIRGVVDPVAASRAILDARDMYVRTVREEILDAEDELEVRSARRGRGAR